MSFLLPRPCSEAALASAYPWRACSHTPPSPTSCVTRPRRICSRASPRRASPRCSTSLRTAGSSSESSPRLRCASSHRACCTNAAGTRGRRSRAAAWVAPRPPPPNSRRRRRRRRSLTTSASSASTSWPTCCARARCIQPSSPPLSTGRRACPSSKRSSPSAVPTCSACRSAAPLHSLCAPLHLLHPLAPPLHPPAPPCTPLHPM